MKYIPTIGLEIHAELKTKTKMFCDSSNDPDEAHPNVNICPVCTGHPGTLPVINREAIMLMIKIGLALDGRIANITKFDRKNYFYPDLPKGYQISQYDEPIVSDGRLLSARVRRIHLEEDAGRLVHGTPSTILPLSKGEEKGGGSHSFVDYNRAGLPLMELVTEPDFKDGKSARVFAEELQMILRYLGASSADMEKGQMRVEANVSVAPEGAPLGTKVEVKNLNSFRAVEGAIAYEIERQSALLDEGKQIVQETRGWDDVKLVTVSQRRKEEAHDYRYFPEPDLPPLNISEMGLDLEKIKNELPELPAAKRARFVKEFGLTAEQAAILVADKAWADYFESAISELGTEAGGRNTRARLLCYNYLTSDFKGLLEERGAQLKESKITPENFADLIVLIASDKISSRTAKDVLRKMEESGEDPRAIIEREGLAQESSSGALEAVAKEILAANPKAVEDYKKGKPAALQFLVGKAMARMLGKGNPPMLQEIFKRLLG
jgi:aspartyl-tRNA(Asn)/glutamyl-tRNA(Gln) amidotransferase subunit B